MFRTVLRGLPQRRCRVLVAASATALLAVALPGYALPPGGFEGADGNLVVDGSGSDWASNTINRVVKPDRETGANDDSFGQGSSEDTAVPSVVTGSIPNNKSDLSNLYVGSESLQDSGGAFHDFLYLGWSRVQDPTGTTNLDFELNQSQTLSGNGVTYVRTAGDVLIKYDLSAGGAKPDLGIQFWITSGAASQCEASNKLPCWSKASALSGSAAEGGLNATTVGNPLTNPPSTFSPRTFGEAAIDLQAAGIFKPGVCTNFGHAFVKSRSSDSFTAATKDFIAPVDIGLNSCPPAKITLKKTSSQGGGLLAGATFQLFFDADGSGTINAGDPQVAPDGYTTGTKDCTTTADGIGNCRFTVTQAGDYLAKETAAPAGYTLDPTPQKFAVVVDRTTRSYTRTFTDAPQPGTISVTKNSDTGQKLAGATFALYTGTGPLDATTLVDTKTTTATGVVTFSGLQPGTYTVKETVAPAGYDLPTTTTQTITVGITSGGDQKSATFTDTPTKGRITVTKKDADSGAVLEGATFQLYRDLGTVGTLDAADVALGTCTSGVLGTCSFTDLAPGAYLVKETAAPSGYDLPTPAYQAVTVAVAAGGDARTLTFDDRLTPGRITVTKYDDSDPKVKLGGAVFELYLDDGDGVYDAGDTSKGTCTTEGDASAAAFGTCTFSDVPLGTYFVREKTAPLGYDLPAAESDRTKKVVITKAAGGDQEAVSFSDPRRFTVITVVCRQKGDKLYPSAVTLDGVTKTSAAAGDLPSGGATESQICSLPGAAFTGKNVGSYTGSVTIAK